MRLCPNCKVELKRKKYKGVSVDECEQCQGIFFDRGELDEAKNNADPDVSWLDFTLFDIKDPKTLEKEQKDCPKCSFKTDVLEYAGSKVIINKCPNCQSVWLDKGEFDRVLSFLENLVAKQTSSDLSEAIKHQLVDIFIGSKNEAEEMRDLATVTRLFEERWTTEHPKIVTLLEAYYSLTPLK